MRIAKVLENPVRIRQLKRSDMKRRTIGTYADTWDKSRHTRNERKLFDRREINDICEDKGYWHTWYDIIPSYMYDVYDIGDIDYNNCHCEDWIRIG